MQTTTPRDILSHDDIATTCGDADCATSDAEMTTADEAVVALVAAEIVEGEDVAVNAAPVVLTLAEINALPAGAKLVRLDDGGAAYVKFAGAQAYAVNADGSKVNGGRKIGWKPGRFAVAS